jgi:quinol monooxygenase YgiN
MTDGMVTNLVFVRARSGKARKLEEALRELAQKARDEQGSFVYEVHHSMADANEYCLYGIWRSRADLDAHMKAAAIQSFLGESTELIDGALNLRLFTPLDVVRI